MLRARTDSSQQTAAASPSQGSGCFSAYVLPPMAVIFVGVLLALFSFNATPRDLTAMAAPSTPLTDPVLDTAVDALAPAPTAIPGTGGVHAQVDQIPGPPAAPQPQALLQLSFPNPSVEAAPAGAKAISSVFTPEVQYWSQALSRWAAKAGIDPNLAAVVMQIESCGDPSATSRSGAIGLFQVMPYHFASTDSPYDPDTNAGRGLDYLRRSLQAANNDARLAFAGYNGGIGVIGRSEWTWPAETVRYAYWGSGIYADAIAGLGESGRLHEWLTAGGSGLCARAGQRLGIRQ
jgi:soluble lytic murein transglycosylase-like protein